MIVVNPTGGGLSNGKLAQATATPADVLSGKTFFAGGKDIKTGTFDLSLANATAAQVLKGYKFYAGNSTLKTGTLVPTPKVKTGSFGPIDIEDTLSIDCGFRPIAVLIRLYKFIPGSTMTAFCYNGATYLTAERGSLSGAGYWDGESYIRFSNTGFIITNSSTFGNDNMYPFSEYNLASTEFNYIAIG